MNVGPHNSNLSDQFESGKEKYSDRRERRKQKTVDLTDKQAVINHVKKGNAPASFVENNWEVWKDLLEKDPADREDHLKENFSGEKLYKLIIMSKTLKRLENFNNQSYSK